jgi:hypothetical protein
MDIIYSRHALEELELRQVPKELADEVLRKPQQVVNEVNKKIYQSIIEFPDKKSYLLRLIIATDKVPNVVITLYRTSKIKKYWRTHES